MARNAAKSSYAPYSRFNVGAAVKLDWGTIITGSNQENAAYPSGLCAERVALFSAGAQYPARAVDTLVIAARNADGELSRPIAPCGACRQVMLEVESRHKRAMRVILFGTDCCYIIKGGAKELLPLSFDSGFLEG
jgi:cytidine deaminase